MTQKKVEAKKQGRTQYSTEFKQQALLRAVKEGIPAVAQDLGLEPAQLYAWRTKSQQRGQAPCAPRLARHLKRGRRPVAQSLRRQGLCAKAARKFKATTNSKHALPVAENLLQQNFTAVTPNQVWVGDITYIQTDEGWLYLAVVMDLWSRKVVGWSMSERMTARLVCDALRMALFRRKRPR
jgi:putative transposase